MSIGVPSLMKPSCISSNFSEQNEEIAASAFSSIPEHESQWCMPLRMYADLSKKGVHSIDAPVSGGTIGAINSTLTFMVGGNSKALKLSMPLLNAMGKRIVHVGESGSGQVAKACNNMLLGISMVALSEVFTLADKIGLDQKKLFQISSEGSGMSWAMLNHLPVANIICLLYTSPSPRD